MLSPCWVQLHDPAFLSPCWVLAPTRVRCCHLCGCQPPTGRESACVCVLPLRVRVRTGARVHGDVRVRPRRRASVTRAGFPVTRERPPYPCVLLLRVRASCPRLSCVRVCEYHPDSLMSSFRRQNRYQCRIFHTTLAIPAFTVQ
jgi:hypothetical protein